MNAVIPAHATLDRHGNKSQKDKHLNACQALHDSTYMIGRLPAVWKRYSRKAASKCPAAQLRGTVDFPGDILSVAALRDYIVAAR